MRERGLRLSTEGSGSSTKAGWLFVWGLGYLSWSLHPWKRRSEVKSCAYVSLICWCRLHNEAVCFSLEAVSGQWGRVNLLLLLPCRSALWPGCARLQWINFLDLPELKQWKMEDIEQVDLLNLTFTRHMKDNGDALFYTMACLSCLQPLQPTAQWRIKEFTVCNVYMETITIWSLIPAFSTRKLLFQMQHYSL